MSQAERVTMCEMSDSIRHYELAFDGNGLARLYCETFADNEGRRRSSSRLYFDGDVRPDVMREIIDVVTARLLREMPRGVCIVYRGHLVSSFDFGAG